MMQIQIEKFSGPLDLLLKIVEQEDLDITQISLAKIADEYLRYLEKPGHIDPEDMADFLLVAAKLLVIKSRALLPNLAPEEEQEISELEAQLRMYKEFVEAARALGAGHGRIFFKHLLPNSLSPIITFSPFVIAGNITALASLDYLGFGLTPPTPSWGELLNQAQKHFTEGWWLAVYPSLALFLTLTMLSLIGEGVRDAMDPKD